MPEVEPILLTTRGQWVSSDWVAVTRGVRRHVDAHDRFLAELLAWQAVLPEGSAFTHLTAARLHHWWLPPLPEGLPVFVAVPAQARIRRVGLVAIRRSTIRPWQRHGVWVDDPVRALLACARDLEELDLTCLVDAALHAGHLSVAGLRAGLPARTRGARRLGAACEAAHPLSESIFETLMRRLHEVCEVDVRPQHEVHDEHGRFLARGDLWLVGTRDLHEYDGADHLTRPQLRKDHQRERRLGRHDWVRRGYTREDVLHQGVRILADADQALGRPHDPARIRAWHALLKESLFTPAGIERLRRRLRLPESGHSEVS